MKKTIIGAVALLANAGLASAQQDFSCPGYGMMYGGYGTGGVIFSWLLGLLTVVALALLIAWLVKQLQKR
ncbi:MAG: hypothetical protein AABX47_02700 [Nanoarchaeota archaeon]